MKRMHRRKFLSNSASSLGLLSIASAWPMIGSLTGCQSLERFLMGEDRDSETRVLIIGAGLAGMTLAYELKKRKVPYVVFEAKDRTGGKIYSIDAFDGIHAADLGASRFYSGDLDFIDLLKELKVPYVESNKELDVSKKELLRKMEALWNQIYEGKYSSSANSTISVMVAENIAGLDLIKASDFILKIKSKLTSAQTQYLEQFLLGLAPNASDVSAFWFLQNFLRVHKGAEHVIPGGMGLVTKALTQRVSGLFQDTFLNVGHELVYLDKDEDFFELKFRSSESGFFKSNRLAKARFLVYAAPLSQVEGIQLGSMFQWPEPLLKLRLKVGESSQARLVFSVSDKSFQKDLGLIKNSRFNLGDGMTLSFRDLENIGNKWGSVIELEGPSDLIMLGSEQLSVIEKKVSQVLKKDIRITEPMFQKRWNRLHLKTEGYETLQLPYFFQEGHFHFAFIGETFSKSDFGNVNGAVQSARMAAEWIQKKALV